MHVTHASNKSNDSRMWNVSARARCLVHTGHTGYSRFQYEGVGHASRGGKLSGVDRMLMLKSACEYRNAYMCRLPAMERNCDCNGEMSALTETLMETRKQ